MKWLAGELSSGRYVIERDGELLAVWGKIVGLLYFPSGYISLPEIYLLSNPKEMGLRELRVKKDVDVIVLPLPKGITFLETMHRSGLAELRNPKDS